KSLRIKRSAIISPDKSKKKAPAKADTRKSAGIDEGTGDNGDEDDVDIDKYDNESTDDDDDNDGNNDDDDGDDSDDKGNDDVNDDDEQKDKDEEKVAINVSNSDDDDDDEKDDEEEDDYELLYRDVNVNLHGDVDMTKAEESRDQPKDQEPVLQYKDAHVTLTASQKTEGQTQSSSVSSSFTSKFLNLENVNPADYTLTTLMDTSPQQTSSLAITITP
ncbi:hypothetical protein Tco_0166302, partial [Tanacetum coccineum]